MFQEAVILADLIAFIEIVPIQGASFSAENEVFKGRDHHEKSSPVRQDREEI